MKNRKTIIVSLISSFVIVVHVIPLLSFLLCRLFGINTGIELKMFYFANNYAGNNGNTKAFVEVIPFIFSISFVELTVAFLRKSLLGSRRFGLIIISLVLMGSMILKVFYGTFYIIVGLSKREQIDLLSSSHIEFPYNLLVMVGIIFFFFVYANRVTRKIKEYIN